MGLRGWNFLRRGWVITAALFGMFHFGSNEAQANPWVGQVGSRLDDETTLEYWPLFTTGSGVVGSATYWWVTREGDHLLDIGSTGDLSNWYGEFNFAEVVQYGVSPQLVGPKVGCKGRIISPGLTGRGVGASQYKIEGGPTATHPQWIELVRVRMHAGDPGTEREVGFLLGHPSLVKIGMQIAGTLAEEKEFTKEDGVEPPHFSDVWPTLLRTRPGWNENPWALGFLEAGRHRIDVHYVDLYGYLPLDEITEPCCGQAVLGGRLSGPLSYKDVWVVGMGIQMPEPPPPPPAMVSGPGAGTTPISGGLFPKGTHPDIRQSRAQFRGDMNTTAPFDVYLAFVAKRVAGSGGHAAEQHAPKNTNVDGDLIDRKDAVGKFQQMFMRIPAGSTVSQWNTYTASDFGGTEVIQMYVSQGRFSAEEQFGVNPGGSNLASAIAVLEDEAKDTCQIDTFVHVRVPYLEDLPPGGSSYEKVGGTCVHHGPSDSADLPDECKSPDNNHWGKPSVIQALRDIAAAYDLIPFTDPIKYNDISLPSGGGFDVDGKWGTDLAASNHSGHRIGKAADVRSAPPISLSGPAAWAFKGIVSYYGGEAKDHGNHWHLKF